MASPVLYTLDTSSLIEASRAYGGSSFEAFWQRLEGLVREERCLLSEEVVWELEQVADELLAWVKRQEGFVASFSREQEATVREIMAAYPKLISIKKNKGSADPYIIALAKHRSMTVITEEALMPQGQPPKIPNVCEDLGVAWMKIRHMSEQEGWVFS